MSWMVIKWNTLWLKVMKWNVYTGSSYGHQSASSQQCTSGWLPSVQQGSTLQVAGLTLLRSHTNRAVQLSMSLLLSTDRWNCSSFYTHVYCGRYYLHASYDGKTGLMFNGVCPVSMCLSVCLCLFAQKLENDRWWEIDGHLLGMC